jgi:hypothetical protein
MGSREGLVLEVPSLSAWSAHSACQGPHNRKRPAGEAKRSAAIVATVSALPMKGTLSQKKAIKLLKGKRLDAGSRRQAPGQDDQGVVCPRFRRHLTAWVERLRQGGVDATHQAALPTGVPA